MRKILMCSIMAIAFTFCETNAAHACTASEIDVNGDGTVCETAKFTITTTELAADTTFAFYMSAMGTFYVDWGDGTVDTITRTDTTETLYDHTYSTAGIKTIRFGGVATRYSTKAATSTVRFGYQTSPDNTTPTLVDRIDGSIGSIFLTLGQQPGQQPCFSRTFAQTGISSAPMKLFDGVTGSRSYMFESTFYGCASLASLPDDLFAGITGAALSLFSHTFMFCSALSSIPGNLFSGINGGDSHLFDRTFYGCKSLRSIPPDLFSGVTNVGYQMFIRTFDGCRSLSGYIPPSLFAGLIANNSPIVTQMFEATFAATRLSTTCPFGTHQYITGYEEYWDGRIACEPNEYICAPGYYLPANAAACTLCPENNYCSGGTYSYNETIASGATQCPNNLYSPTGMSSASQCGHILHIGNDIVYLHSVKKTTPSLNAKIGNDIFYGNMTTADVVMNASTTHKLQVRYNDTTYSIYDDTVAVP